MTLNLDGHAVSAHALVAELSGVGLIMCMDMLAGARVYVSQGILAMPGEADDTRVVQLVQSGSFPPNIHTINGTQMESSVPGDREAQSTHAVLPANAFQINDDHGLCGPYSTWAVSVHLG